MAGVIGSEGEFPGDAFLDARELTAVDGAGGGVARFADAGSEILDGETQGREFTLSGLSEIPCSGSQVFVSVHLFTGIKLRKRLG